MLGRDKMRCRKWPVSRRLVRETERLLGHASKSYDPASIYMFFFFEAAIIPRFRKKEKLSLLLVTSIVKDRRDLCGGISKEIVAIHRGKGGGKSGREGDGFTAPVVDNIDEQISFRY